MTYCRWRLVDMMMFEITECGMVFNFCKACRIFASVVYIEHGGSIRRKYARQHLYLVVLTT